VRTRNITRHTLKFSSPAVDAPDALNSTLAFDNADTVLNNVSSPLRAYALYAVDSVMARCAYRYRFLRHGLLCYGHITLARVPLRCPYCGILVTSRRVDGIHLYSRVLLRGRRLPDARLPTFLTALTHITNQHLAPFCWGHTTTAYLWPLPCLFFMV